MKLELLGATMGTALLGGLYAWWPFDNGKVYDRTPAQSYEILARMPLPIIFDRVVEKMPEGSFTRDGVPDTSMTWTFKVKGKEGARFSVAIEPASEGKSRVSTDFRLIDDGKAFPNAEAFETIAEVAMKEQADSRLEGRRFHAEDLAMAVAAYGLRHREEIFRTAQAEISAAEKRGDLIRARQAAERRIRAEHEEAGVSFAPGQPMIRTAPGDR